MQDICLSKLCTGTGFPAAENAVFVHSFVSDNARAQIFSVVPKCGACEISKEWSQAQLVEL